MKALLANLLGAIGKSFTLVELLVVVAIIGVLAALLLPAVGTAKDRAKAVVCAHNEKRMGEAFNSYLNDNQGFYPYIYPTCANTTNNNTIGGCALGAYIAAAASAQCASSLGWNINLAQYYGYSKASFITRIAFNMCAVNCGWGGCGPPDSQICQDIAGYAKFMQCPSNPWQISMGTPWTCQDPNMVGGFAQPGGGMTWRLFATTYAMNGDGFPVTFGSGVCTDPTGFNKCVNMSDINHPSSLALIGEMPWNQWIVSNPNPPSSWGLAYLPGQIYMSASGVGTNNGPAATQWTNLTRYAYCNGNMAAWHGNGMNTLFTDGHVEKVSQSTLRTNSAQYLTTTTTSSPGWLFFNDGKARNWFAGQFPGYNFPQRF